MTIKQLSVFLENKSGRINEVTKVLGENGINMQAFSMAETTDFGILRLIVSDVDKAVEVLRAKNFAVVLTDVVCICCPNVAGALSKILEKLAAHQISLNICMPLLRAIRRISSSVPATLRSVSDCWRKKIATFWTGSNCNKRIKGRGCLFP